MQPNNYMLNLPNPTAEVMNGLKMRMGLDQIHAEQQQRAMAQEQYQQKQDQAAQLRADLTKTSQDPTPDNITRLMLKHPTLAKNLQIPFANLNDKQKQAKQSQMAEVYASLQSGDTQTAQNLLNEYSKAHENAGDPAGAKRLQDLAQVVKLHPNTAATSVGTVLASMMGPHNFAASMKALNAPPPGELTAKDKFDAGYNPTTGKPLKTLEDTADLIAHYKLNPPTGRAAASKDARLLMSEVKRINPQFSAQDWFKQKKAVMDFGSGKQGNTVRSLNVGVQHLDLLDNLASGMSSHDTRLVNKVQNAWRTQFGSPLSTNFDAAKTIVADEIAKAVIGGPTAEKDREELAKVLDKAGSWDQIKGVVHTLEGLMAGQLSGLRDQYKSSTGRSEDTFNAALDPRTMKVLRDVQGRFDQGNISDTNQVTIQGKTYTRPQNMSDADWAAYKASHGPQ